MLGVFTSRKMFRYAVMPEFMARINSLVGTGFQNVAYLLAVIYQMVRLLPANHPYLDVRNLGRFGIRHVIAEAANNLVISRKNIDQIVLFVAILMGMLMLSMQILLFAAAIFLQPVHAAPAGWGELFVNPDPEQDIANIMLDLVFGIPGANWVPGAGGSFFESCVGSALPCLDTSSAPLEDIDLSKPEFGGIATMPTAGLIGPLANGAFTQFPFPIHYGMQALFGMFNLGLLLVASIITTYFIATVIAETAQSGTPFGKRFNKLWAPIRIVMAFGLLMPLASFGAPGMNSAQYLVLYAAKYGSNFATNGWNRFNDTLATTNYLGGDPDLAISTPNVPEIESISLFMWLVNVCYHISQYQKTDATEPVVDAWVIGRQDKAPTTLVSQSLDDLLVNFYDPFPKMVTIRFGQRSAKLYPKEAGNVKPTCGEIQIPLTDARSSASGSVPAPGVVLMQNFYYELISDMWEEDPATSPYTIAQSVLGGDLRSKAFAYRGINNEYETGYSDPLTTSYISFVNTTIENALQLTIDAAVLAQQGDPSWLAGPCSNGAGSTIQNKGWAGAAIWYNCLAELNGSLTTAVTAIPSPTLMPSVMENIAAIKSQYDTYSKGTQKYQPSAAEVKDTAALLNYGKETQAAQILYEALMQWNSGSSSTQTKSSNGFTAAIATFLGVNGLYDMRKNDGVHPLAQLVGIGRALVEAATRKMGYAVGAAGLSAVLQGADGGLAATSASLLVTIAMLGLTAGFVLFYIVPFLPFIYFFFALGGWVKGIFEAMVGAPLWALAHIRIDGNGLPGNAALNGYFLIFEIFLRPILTLFGLLASVTIFSALVGALNNVFDLVVTNTTGFDIEKEVTGAAADSIIESMRGAIDEFFFTIIYAIIVYMMAMSSFKLIDQVPNNILRWMGQTVQTFGDTREDPAQGLMSKAGGGAQQAFSKLGAGLQGAVGGIASIGKK